MRVSTEEMETTVNIYKTDETAKLYSCDPRFMRKMDRLCEKYPNEYKVVGRDEISATYSFPKKRLKFSHSSEVKANNA